MKRFLCLLVCMLFLLPGAANAEEFTFPDFLMRVSLMPYESREWLAPTYFNDSPGTPVEYYVAGEKRTTGLPILLEQGRTLLPLRLVGEACGAEVTWNNELKQATVRIDESSALVRPGCTELWLDGQSRVDMGVAPAVRDGVLYLPLRAVGEALGKEVLYCSRLQQGFVMVYDKGAGSYDERRQFNRLMQLTYLSNYDAIWDIGRQNVITEADDRLQIDGSNMFEHTFLGTGGLTVAGQIEEKLGCLLISELMPIGNSYKVIALYADGDVLSRYPGDENFYTAHNYTDVRILWDGMRGCNLQDGLVYGDYWYAVEMGMPTAVSGLFRVDLTTPQQEYFVPEYLGADGWEYGRPPAYGEPYLVAAVDGLYAYGQRYEIGTDGSSVLADECWFRISLDGTSYERVDKLPEKAEWLHSAV